MEEEPDKIHPEPRSPEMASAVRAPKRSRSVGVDVPPGSCSGGGVEQGRLDVDDLDHISRLPDEVLGTVVSLLPTKEGARTQVLSRRWQLLWRSPMAPLNLTADFPIREDESFLSVVSKILSDHPGPARRFMLFLLTLSGPLGEVDRWFCSATLDGLQELDLTNRQVPRYELPPHALTRFAPTLRMLNLHGFEFTDPMVPSSFPHLKQLTLYGIGISENSLQCMISGCAVLESVWLGVRFHRLCIISQTLRSFSLDAQHSPEGELVIEYAPCLERLLPNYPDRDLAAIRVIRAPKLEILGFYSQTIPTLQLGTIVFQDVSHTRTRCTAEEGASTVDKKRKQSKTDKIEHMVVFSVICLMRYAEAKGILTLITEKLELPSKMTAGIVFLFVTVKSLYHALKETKDIKEVLAYFRKIGKQDAPPVQDKEGAAKS